MTSERRMAGDDKGKTGDVMNSLQTRSKFDRQVVRMAVGYGAMR